VGCSRLAGCVHSSVNKPGANGRVSYNTLTHSRLYCREGEKVGHELRAVSSQTRCTHCTDHKQKCLHIIQRNARIARKQLALNYTQALWMRCVRCIWLETTLQAVTSSIFTVSRSIRTSSVHIRARRMTYNSLHSVVRPHRCLQCFDAVGWVAGRASGL